MINWTLILAILLPNMGGWASTISMIGQVRRPDGKAWYQLLHKPSWTPPDQVFAPIWIILYTGMGYASYIIYNALDGFAESLLPMMLYGGQLIFNFSWTPIFFGLHQLGWALGHMLVLDVLATACTISFYQTSAIASYLMVPYLAWLAFATCLNCACWRLN